MERSKGDAVGRRGCDAFLRDAVVWLGLESSNILVLVSFVLGGFFCGIWFRSGGDGGSDGGSRLAWTRRFDQKCDRVVWLGLGLC